MTTISYPIAVVIAALLAIFSKPQQSPRGDYKYNKLTNYYFQYIGIPGNEEYDNSKWEQINQTAYYSILTPPICLGSHKGCKLISTSVTTINGVVRPTEVYVDYDYSSSPGHYDPQTGTTIIEVRNYRTQ